MRFFFFTVAFFSFSSLVLKEKKKNSTSSLSLSLFLFPSQLKSLIYYLGSKAPEFMRSLGSLSAPGSVLLLDALDEPGVASAVRKAEGRGLQGQFSFGVPADPGDLARFFAAFGFDRLVAADTWTVLRERFRREAPGRCFTKDKPSCGRVEGGIRFIAVSKSFS